MSNSKIPTDILTSTTAPLWYLEGKLFYVHVEPNTSCCECGRALSGQAFLDPDTRLYTCGFPRSCADTYLATKDAQLKLPLENGNGTG